MIIESDTVKMNRTLIEEIYVIQVRNIKVKIEKSESLYL